MKTIQIKTLFVAVAMAGSAFAQSGPTLLAISGASWLRGAPYPVNNSTSIGIELGASSFYSWSEVVTPIARNPGSTAPLPSTITSGVSDLLVCSPTRSVCLLVAATGGVYAAGSTAAAPAFTGDTDILI